MKNQLESCDAGGWCGAGGGSDVVLMWRGVVLEVAGVV